MAENIIYTQNNIVADAQPNGTMTHNTSAWEGSATQTSKSKTYQFNTVEKYLDKNINFTVTVKDGEINSPSGTGSATISSGTFAYDSGNSRYNLTGSASISGSAYRNVTTAGWLSTSTTSGSVSGTASLSTIVARTNVTSTITGTGTRSHSITRQAFTISGVNDAASGAATTTAPTSGVYVMANAAANTATIYANINAVSKGYSDGANYGTTNGSATAGAAAIGATYIPITIGSINSVTASGSATISSGTFAYDSGNTRYNLTGSASISGSAYRNITKSGWLNANTTGGSVSGTASLSATVARTTATAAITGTPARSHSITRQSFSISGVVDGASGSATTTAPTSGVYVMANAAANTASIYANITAVSAGYSDGTNYGTSNSAAVTAGASAIGNTYIPITIGTLSGVGGSGTATSDGLYNSSNSGVNASDKILLTTAANGRYRLNAIGSGGANVTKSGWLNAGTTKSTSGNNYYYVNKATISAYAGTSKTQSTPSFSFDTSTGIVTASVAKTTQTIYRNVSEGYVPSANTTGGTFTLDATSNTYTIGVTSRTAGAGSASTTGANVVFTTTNTGISVTATGSGSVSTGTGYITSGSTSSSSATNTRYLSGVNVPSGITFGVNMANNATLNVYDSITGKYWLIKTDSASNALTIVQA